ncbi:MAG: Cache domain protein [Methanoregulaceae archaeon PtaB.Bin056]|nr:MAG: Cache domain protein [Methanoregulaceae archaeon PtaB.Bin056]
MSSPASAFVILAILMACLLSAGCIDSQRPGPATPAPTPFPIPPKGAVVTTKDVIAYVDAAAGYAREVGKEKAIAEFNDPESRFNQGALYIFAEDANGNALAEPFQHEIVGTNIMHMVDSYGIPLVENLVDTGMKGRGLVSYCYPNPSRNYTIEPKVSYVVNIDPTYYIGAGHYENLGTTFPAKGMEGIQRDLSREDLVAFVNEAVDFAREAGKEQAVAAFRDPEGQFIRGELYVIAYDFNETNLAHPYAPWLEGLILTHYTDQDAVATIAHLSDIAERGGGFTHTTQKIPVAETWVFAPKLHYVLPVDETWWISAAILNPDYTRIRSGNLSGIRIRNQDPQDLVAAVSSAVNYTLEHGKEQGLIELGKTDASCRGGGICLWAEDASGTLLADSSREELVGQNILEATDAYGEKTTLSGISTIRNGTGFVHAMVPDRAGGSGKPIPALVYRRAVDETWWICGSMPGIEIR